MFHIIETGLTFIHVPRTAGTSIRNWGIAAAKENSQTVKSVYELMESNDPYIPAYKQSEGFDAHLTLNMWKEYLDIKYSFGVVRNPWDRMVSMYHHVVDNLSEKNHNLKSDINQISGFEQWINHINNHGPVGSRLYWFNEITPQIEWLDGVDYIIRMENLYQEFEEIQRIVNCSTHLHKENWSNRSNYKDYYNDNTRKIVGRLYEKDIDTFKYIY